VGGGLLFLRAAGGMLSAPAWHSIRSQAKIFSKKIPLIVRKDPSETTGF
jgi:hypothetical protein